MDEKLRKLFSFLYLTKRQLLFVSVIVWAFAGGMLIYRGIVGMSGITDFGIKLTICFVLGILFFRGMFLRISQKTIVYITQTLPEERNLFYKFFRLKSYLMMGIMIGLGITLRKTGLVPIEYLSMFYIIMGTPLLISSFRFFQNAVYYRRIFAE